MFQLVYGGGVENIKAFSELNDPIDQEARFAEQTTARENGDEEAQFSDTDFVEALKHGMPPTAGFGIGIDRLTATLTDSPNLKEVISFSNAAPGTMSTVLVFGTFDQIHDGHRAFIKCARRKGIGLLLL